MQFPINTHRGVLATGRPRIDWNNPLTGGLTACYVPSWCGTTIYDLVGGLNLVCGSGASYTLSQEGRAFNTTTAGATAVASPMLRPVNQASVFWRGVLLGTPASNDYLCGVEFQDGSTTPFNAYDVSYWNDGSLTGNCNNGTGEFTAHWALPPTNIVIDAAVTVDLVGGNLFLYGNGINVGTTAPGAGTINYGANPQAQIGGTTAVPGCNALTLAGFLWNRALSAKETRALHDNPYQFLIFPEDDIFATIFTPAVAVVTVKSYPPFRRMVI